MSLVEDADQASNEAELRAALNTALRKLEKAKAKTEDLVEAVYRGVKDAHLAEPTRPIPKPRVTSARGKPEVALWHLTDWQGAKVTPSYSTEVMRRRVDQFVDRAEKITAIQRADHPVRDCTILFGGDMVEGLFQFPNQVFEVDATIFDQWVSVYRLIAHTVTRALSIYDHVTVVGEWGNHGRIGSKRDAVPTSDNIDRMCYWSARDKLEHQVRLSWEDGPEDIQRVEIGTYRALLMHGDEAGRHGYVSQSTFLNYLNGLKAGAYRWDFKDVYTGHYHTHHELPLRDGDGAWYQTGSTESENRYARDRLGSVAEPSQRLHFIDPEKGRVTAQYKVYLD